MEERILKILKEVNSQIAKGVDLIEENIIDSFEIVNIVAFLEQEFDIEIDPEDIIGDNFKTVEAIVALVEKIVNQ